jgi:hypothetical protein
MAAGPDTWWTKIAGIKQGTGIVGRLCTVAVVAFGALGMGLFVMPGAWERALIVLAGVVVVAGLFLVFVDRMLRYARENPLHATLEGEALIKMLEMAAKGQAPSVPTANVEAPKAIELKPEQRPEGEKE